MKELPAPVFRSAPAGCIAVWSGVLLPDDDGATGCGSDGLAVELVSGDVESAQLGEPGAHFCVTVSGVLLPAYGFLAALLVGTVATIPVRPPALVLLPSR